MIAAPPGPSRPRTPVRLGRVRSGALVALALVGMLLASSRPIGDNDYGMHLRLGSEIARSGPPRTDSHSFTLRGAAYPDHEWLSQLLWFEAYGLLGDRGMVAFQAALVALAMGLVLLSTHGPLSLRLGVTVAAFLLSLHHIQARPHLLSWVYAAALGSLLARKMHWPILLLLWVWANCHGSVPLGVGFASLHFLEQLRSTRKARFLGFAAASVLLPLVNPYGQSVYTLYLEIAGSTGFIGEWKPYEASTAAWWLLVALFASAAAGLFRSRPFSPFDLVRTAVLAILAFSSSRNGVVAAIYLAPLLSRWHGRRVRDVSDRVLALLLALVPVLVLANGVRQGRVLSFRLDHQHLPIAAVEFLHRHRIEGPLFNDYNFGGWLLWKGWPEYPVFVDGRTEVYQGEVLDQYLAMSRAAPGYREALSAWGIQSVLIRPERDLAHALLREPGWELVYFDYNSMIFVRRGTSPSTLRLEVATPFGPRSPDRKARELLEIEAMIHENPLFFGGHKIRAFLLHGAGDSASAREALRRYLELYPEGLDRPDTQRLIAQLTHAGAWP